MRKRLLSITFIIAVLLLAACGTNDGAEETTGNEDEATSSDVAFEKVKEAGVIEIGSTTSGPPFTFLNTDTNEIDGIMIDFVNYIGEDLDLDVNVNAIQWGSLIPSMDSGKIDMVAAAMAITDERSEVLDFTDPIYTYGETIIVLEDNDDVQTIDDLEGYKVGVQEASIYYNGILESPEIDHQVYKTHQDMAKELENGRIDVFFADYPVFNEMLKELPELEEKIKIIRPKDPQWIAEIGIAVPKDSPDFIAAVNESLVKMEEDGTKDELLQKWGLD